MRPSTSPDLALIQSVALNRAKSLTNLVAQSQSNTTTMAITSMNVGPRPPLPRGPSMGKLTGGLQQLNPLVASINSGGHMLGMMVVGQQYGEEKTVSTIERRHSISTPGAEVQAMSRQQRSENIHTKDQQRIRKLEADLKRLQDQFKQRNDEYQTLQNFADSQRTALAHLEAEKDKAGQLLNLKQQKKSDEFESLKQKLAKMQAEKEEMLALHTRQRKELEQSLLERIDREKRALEEERDKNKAAFRLKDEECRADMAKWKTEIEALQTKIRQSRLEHEQDMAKLKVEKGSQKDVE